MSFSIRALHCDALTLCQLTLSWLPAHCLLPNPQASTHTTATTVWGQLSCQRRRCCWCWCCCCRPKLVAKQNANKNKGRQAGRFITSRRHPQFPLQHVSQSVVVVVVFTPESEPRAGLFCPSCHGNCCGRQKQKPFGNEL